jgi:nucleotide-binding universal stress UspA family protein
VVLTNRAAATVGAGIGRQLKRWWRTIRSSSLAEPSPAVPADGAQVILVAVDTEHMEDDRHPALQRATRAIVSLSPDFRLMFVSAIRAAPLGEGTRLEDTASGKHLEHRNRLRRWVEPLKLPPSHMSLHVMESDDPAGTLLEMARLNHVDLIVLGAPGRSDRALAWWRSAASTVTANAPCSVHVVRVPEDRTGAADPETGAATDGEHPDAGLDDPR